MRVFFIFCSVLITYVACKYNAKMLTESMGQEVIEIASPLNDLNPDLEEEPSAEVDEPVHITSTTLQAATPKDLRKPTLDGRRKMKDVDKIDGNRKEDDEMKIEKELAELYKDAADADYKDSSEVTKEETNSTFIINDDNSKPIARLGNQFKFHPDSNDPEEIARFRTSVDDINCAKNRLSATTIVPSSGHTFTICRILIWSVFVLVKLQRIFLIFESANYDYKL